MYIHGRINKIKEKHYKRAYLNDLEDGLPRWRQHTTRLASVSGSLASCTIHKGSPQTSFPKPIITLLNSTSAQS